MSFYTNFMSPVDNTSGHTSYPSSFVYTYGYSFPAGTIDSAGGRLVRFDGVNVEYASGASGIYGAIRIGATNYLTGSVISSSGGACGLVCGYSSGTLYFGRRVAAGGTVVDAGDGSTWGGMLCGGLNWSTVPPAPTMLGATPGPGGQMTVQFSGNGNGGSAITGWVLQYATNSSFSGATTIASTGTSVLTLAPGTQYWFRSAGRNSLSDAYSRYGPWSSAITATTLAGGLIFTGSTWDSAYPMVFDGSAWVPATGLVYDGAAWQPIG
jgi:hypothetical protein